MNLDKIKCFLLDMDGTVYLGGVPIEGAAEAVARMKKQARVIFVTNNSSASAQSYCTKLKKLGFDSCPGDVYTSALATIDYLKEHHAGKSVYLCASEDVTAEFASAGIKLTDGDSLTTNNPVNNDALSIGSGLTTANHLTLGEAKPDIVCLTFDKTLTYDKLRELCGFLNRGAFFVATHPDKVCPVDGGNIPDVGCFLKAVKCATGRSPDVICGKPYKPFGLRITKMTGLHSREIAMVGDRLSTDFKFAKNCGFTSVVVLSGEATAADIQKLNVSPDFVLDSIADWDKI